MMNPLAGPAGPGKFSTRTDKLEMGSTAYGEGVETQAIKSGAPLAKTGDVKGMPASEVRAAAEVPLTGLFAETERPDEPITSGIDRGEGPGSSALRMNKVTVKLSDTLAQMLPFDTTGEIAVLYQEALSRGN
jgi:uncharacterized protein (DUF2126 family)